MAKKPANIAKSSSEEIDEQVAAFLKKGGKIEKIPSGTSGVSSLKGRKHINLQSGK